MEQKYRPADWNFDPPPDLKLLKARWIQKKKDETVKTYRMLASMGMIPWVLYESINNLMNTSDTLADEKIVEDQTEDV